MKEYSIKNVIFAVICASIFPIIFIVNFIAWDFLISRFFFCLTGLMLYAFFLEYFRMETELSRRRRS